MPQESACPAAEQPTDVLREQSRAGVTGVPQGEPATQSTATHCGTPEAPDLGPPMPTESACPAEVWQQRMELDPQQKKKRWEHYADDQKDGDSLEKQARSNCCDCSGPSDGRCCGNRKCMHQCCDRCLAYVEDFPRRICCHCRNTMPHMGQAEWSTLRQEWTGGELDEDDEGDREPTPVPRFYWCCACVTRTQSRCREPGCYHWCCERCLCVGQGACPHCRPGDGAGGGAVPVSRTPSTPDSDDWPDWDEVKDLDASGLEKLAEEREASKSSRKERKARRSRRRRTACVETRHDNFIQFQ